jgi:pimeloyl-ACP methyl ester carboxylesterase
VRKSQAVPKVDLRNRVLHLLISIAIGYVALLVLVRLFESHLIFFSNYPDRLSGEWNPRGLPRQEIWLTACDGTKFHAWWIPNENARFTFLAFHGNAGNITDRASIYEFLNGTPANVLAVEYQGYGRSEGRASEAGFYRDADAAYSFLVDTIHIDSKTIISFGQSLGTAVAAHLAATPR